MTPPARRFPSRRLREAAIWTASLLTLGSGLLDIYAVSYPLDSARLAQFLRLFPFADVDLSRRATLLAGLALVVLSQQLLRRKRRAWRAALVLTALSVPLHLFRGAAFEEAAVSAAVLAALWTTGSRFTVRSRSGEWTGTAAGLLAAFTAAVFYGVAGFLLLDRREFGLDFHFAQALGQTLSRLSFAPDGSLVPHTRHALWFLESLPLLGGAVAVYALYTVFGPAIDRYAVHPADVARARHIVDQDGASALDAFKAETSKSLYFAENGGAFLAYRVANGCAIVLGDPVGPPAAIPGILAEFLNLCRDNDWTVCFYQVGEAWLPVYESHRLRRLKIGDEAVVDLTGFTLEGSQASGHRRVLRQMERDGVRAEWHDPPHSAALLAAVRTVSDDWLRIPGRAEHGFSVGHFEEGYLQQGPLFAVYDSAGRLVAFANVIRSGRPGEATVDLMRHRRDAPSGVMAFLFLQLLVRNQTLGFTRFTLGLAPLGGFGPTEQPRRTERAVHTLFAHLQFLFSFEGLRAFKAKFATGWEPRYLIYRRQVDLPALGLALRLVSELPPRR